MTAYNQNTLTNSVNPTFRFELTINLEPDSFDYERLNHLLPEEGTTLSPLEEKRATLTISKELFRDNLSFVEKLDELLSDYKVKDFYLNDVLRYDNTLSQLLSTVLGHERVFKKFKA